MKRLNGIVLAVVPTLFLTGCGDVSKNDVAKLSFDKLSVKEEQILNLTENRVFFYNIKDIDKSNGYKIDLNYEFYKEGKEVRREPILSMINETYEDGKDYLDLGINIKEGNKINCLLSDDGVYTNNAYEFEENIEDWATAVFSGDSELELAKGKRICIYYGTSENYIEAGAVGMDMDSEEVQKVINKNKENIFLTISINDFESEK